MIDDYPVTVCGECHRASCWQGTYLCEKSRSASTVELCVGDLHNLVLENPDYWFKSPHTGQIDQHARARYESKYGAKP